MIGSSPAAAELAALAPWPSPAAAIPADERLARLARAVRGGSLPPLPGPPRLLLPWLRHVLAVVLPAVSGASHAGEEDTDAIRVAGTSGLGLISPDDAVSFVTEKTSGVRRSCGICERFPWAAAVWKTV